MGGEGQIESQRGGGRHVFCPEDKKTWPQSELCGHVEGVDTLDPPLYSTEKRQKT